MEPYEKELRKLKGTVTEVTIHRADAPDITGTVREIRERTCTIAAPSRKDSEASQFVTIAYRDIRGVSEEKWDGEKMGR